jgi:hypothetical protein
MKLSTLRQQLAVPVDFHTHRSGLSQRVQYGNRTNGYRLPAQLIEQNRRVRQNAPDTVMSGASFYAGIVN